MAAKVVSDNQFDHELAGKKSRLDGLNRELQSLMASFATLPPKERAKTISKIQNAVQEFQRFFQQPHQQEIVTAGTRFAFENLKSSFSTFQARWQKFEKSLG